MLAAHALLCKSEFPHYINFPGEKIVVHWLQQRHIRAQTLAEAAVSGETQI